MLLKFLIFFINLFKTIKEFFQKDYLFVNNNEFYTHVLIKDKYYNILVNYIKIPGRYNIEVYFENHYNHFKVINSREDYKKYNIKNGFTYLIGISDKTKYNSTFILTDLSNGQKYDFTFKPDEKIIFQIPESDSDSEYIPQIDNKMD